MRQGVLFTGGTMSGIAQERRATAKLAVLWALVLALWSGAPWGVALAQNAPLFNQAELDQMLAPVALYPDALLSQVLMAASYPLEVVEAQRWTVANPALTGAAAVQAVDQADWDPSVKSLVAFPRILQTMSARLDWTERLGDAFLGQQQQVMDTIQALRQKAWAAGNLVSTAQHQVFFTGNTITIVAVNPHIAWTPYYDPGVVYGPWWWPQYPPTFWEPWPGYAYINGYGRGFLWGPGVVVGIDFLFGGFDWRAHHLSVDYARWHGHLPAQVRRDGPVPWQHSPGYRPGLPQVKPLAPVLPRISPELPAPPQLRQIAPAQPPNRAAEPAHALRPEPPHEARPGSPQVPCPPDGCKPPEHRNHRAPDDERQNDNRR